MGDSIFWLIAVVLFIIVEGLTTALVSVWFAVGAAVALLASFLPIGMGWQWIIFAVTSAVALAIMVPRLAAHRARYHAPVTNGSPLTIGKQGVVLRDITPGTVGRVHVDGLDWQARSSVALPKDTACKVVDVDGFVLIVESVTASEPAIV